MICALDNASSLVILTIKKRIQIIWYGCKHFFYNSGCHIPWKCFPILPTVSNAILTSITRYFACYWHWLTHSCPTLSTIFSYSSQFTWISSIPTFSSQHFCSTIQLHINPTFLDLRLRNGISSQSFNHYPRPTKWNQVSYASFSF